MRLSLSELRRIIREEIGRNLRSGERLDHYPWVADDIRVRIYPDAIQEKWWAEVEVEPGKVIRALKPNQEEASFWAREQWEKARRKKFAVGEISVDDLSASFDFEK